ncbi:MAG TPA: TadE/TadG family type IV pilus assembly protein [Candidatus Bathyarchaeia archaeon]|nr:TadE/TadG family type IV pilus assembly protein [Candidatus Bathyarchaeia archaeon]
MTDERGQAMVEFALVLPLLLVLLLGVALVAEIGVARLALEHAAAEAARTGSLTNDDDLVRSTVAAAVGPLDPSLVKVIIEPTQNEDPRSSAPRGSLIRVRLRYPLSVPLAFVGLPRLIVEGTAARRVEWTP